MHGIDIVACGEVGNGSRDPQDAVIGACGQTQAFHGAVEQGVLAFAKRAIPLGFAIAEPGVGLAGTRQLPLAGHAHAFAHLCRAFSRMTGAQLGMVDPRHFELEVDAIEQRPGNPRSVTCNLIGRAAAAPAGIAGVTAWTRIYCFRVLPNC